MHFLENNQLVCDHILDTMQRNYDISLPHNKIPDDLCQLAIRMATPAMGAGEQFKPEAAIVNYFGLGTFLVLYSLSVL